MVDANEHSDASHDTGPLPLELVWLSQMAVEAGIQQANNSCRGKKKSNKQTQITQVKQKFCEPQKANPVRIFAECVVLHLVTHLYTKLCLNRVGRKKSKRNEKE